MDAAAATRRPSTCSTAACSRRAFGFLGPVEAVAVDGDAARSAPRCSSAGAGRAAPGRGVRRSDALSTMVFAAIVVMQMANAFECRSDPALAVLDRPASRTGCSSAPSAIEALALLAFVYVPVARATRSASARSTARVAAGPRDAVVPVRRRGGAEGGRSTRGSRGRLPLASGVVRAARRRVRPRGVPAVAPALGRVGMCVRRGMADATGVLATTGAGGHPERCGRTVRVPFEDGPVVPDLWKLVAWIRRVVPDPERSGRDSRLHDDGRDGPHREGGSFAGAPVPQARRLPVRLPRRDRGGYHRRSPCLPSSMDGMHAHGTRHRNAFDGQWRESCARPLRGVWRAAGALRP